MSVPRHHPGHVHFSAVHLLIILGFIALPIIFLLSFSQAAHLDATALFADIVVSMVRLAVAYVIAAVLGWLCAALFYRGRRATVALPVLDVLQSFPTFAALPLATLLWGTTSFTVIVFLVMTIIWPIFFSVIGSLKLIQRDWKDAVTMSGLRGWQYFRLFLWPVSVPGLITGSVIGLGEGWEALVATEIIVKNPTGLGSFFQQYSQSPAITVFGILGLLLIIFSMNKMIWLPLLDWSHRQLES